jgi:hypothetical protein
MSAKNEPKITRMLDLHRPGTVLLAAWLEAQGISRGLQQRYRSSGWLVSIGAGAFKRPSEKVTWQGGLYALQEQAKLPIHVGATTALGLHGLTHYLRFGGERVFLFSPPRAALPAWFKKHDWNVEIRHVRTSIVRDTLGLTDHEEKNFPIRISAPERAVLECLHLAPEEVDLTECFHLMEGLVNLRPNLVRDLLSACTSVKAKRLFLYLAEKANHQWLSRIDASKLDLGDGHRRLTTGGVYVAKYQLTVPRELAAL